jgi:uncharacterized membrane protein YhhN
MTLFILTLLILISAGMTILGRTRNNKICVYVFKPLTMVLIMAVCLTAGGFQFNIYTLLIAAGLIFSLCGDIFLMLPHDRFIPGLASFLVAHLFYMGAFLTRGMDGFFYWPLAPLLLVGFWIIKSLFHVLCKSKTPVSAYMLVIIVMAWQAWEAALDSRTGYAWSACAGALLFILSDSILAWNRFRHPFKSAEAIKLGLYYTAQWLIAFSVKF